MVLLTHACTECGPQTLQEQVDSGHASDAEAVRKATSSYETLSEEVKASKREVLKRIETETAEAIDRTNRLREDVWSSQVAESKASYEAMEKLSKTMRDELWSQPSPNPNEKKSVSLLAYI